MVPTNQGFVIEKYPTVGIGAPWGFAYNID